MRINFSLLLATTVRAAAESHDHSSLRSIYRADITEIPGTDSDVTGAAYVFTDAGITSIGYAGFASNAEPNLRAATCNATNGCGVHIHNGTSCADTDSQGGHYFVPSTAVDPWIDIRYSSDANGYAPFSGIVDIGTDDVNGLPFIFHAEDGSRLGCGILTKVADSEFIEAAVIEISDSGVSGHVVAHQGKDKDFSDMVCFFATASGLEPSLSSYLDESSVISGVGGADCNFTNGCGLHFHNGTSCESSATQGGHLYNESVVNPDPWLTIGYLSTDASGNAHHAQCVSTGVTEFIGRPFIFHSNNGSRVACGVVETSQEEQDDDPPTATTSSAISLILSGQTWTIASLSSLFILSFWI